MNYIESHGNEYIDTGVTLSDELGTKVKFSTGNGSQILMGAVVVGEARFQPLVTESGNLHCDNCIEGGSENSVNLGIVDSGIHTLLFNVYDSKIIYDGVEKGTVKSIGISTTHIYLFARNYMGANYFSRAKFYGCSFYRNGIAIKNFVPCYDTVNNVYGM